MVALSTIGERLVVLVAAAMLAGLGAAAAVERHEPHRQIAPASVAAPGGGWFAALAGSRGPSGDAERTTCRLILTAASLGVTEPVLPCGARVVIRFGDRTYSTTVIDNRLKDPARQFELTDALARRMGLDGTQRIEWRFAARGG